MHYLTGNSHALQAHLHNLAAVFTVFNDESVASLAAGGWQEAVHDGQPCQAGGIGQQKGDPQADASQGM